MVENHKWANYSFINSSADEWGGGLLCAMLTGCCSTSAGQGVNGCKTGGGGGGGRSQRSAAQKLWAEKKRRRQKQAHEEHSTALSLQCGTSNQRNSIAAYRTKHASTRCHSSNLSGEVLPSIKVSESFCMITKFNLSMDQQYIWSNEFTNFSLR